MKQKTKEIVTVMLSRILPDFNIGYMYIYQTAFNSQPDTIRLRHNIYIPYYCCMWFVAEDIT